MTVIVSAANGNVGIAVLIGLVLLCIGLVAFLFYSIYDKRLDRQIAEAGMRDSTGSPEDEFHFKDTVQVIKNPAFWMIAFLCLLFYAAVNPFLKYSTGMMISCPIRESFGSVWASFPTLLTMAWISPR